MKKNLLLLLFALMTNITMNAQGSFKVLSDGTFVTEDGKRYIELQCPGYSKEELYYAYLVTIEHKCVSSGVQYSTVANRCINAFPV